MSKGYWVVHANILDPIEYQKYVQLAGEIVKEFNGKFLVRGGLTKNVEEKGYDRTVVVEFKTYEDALECYESDSYKNAIKYTKNSSKRFFSIVKGL